MPVVATNPLDVNDRCLFFEIMGLPQNPNAVIVTSLTKIPPVLSAQWMPTFTIGYLQPLIDQLNTQLDNLSDAQCTRCRVYLPQWDQVGGASPMEIERSAAGDQGQTVLSAPKTREGLRRQLCQIVGYTCPTGGWYEDIQRRFAYLRDEGSSNGAR